MIRVSFSLCAISVFEVCLWLCTFSSPDTPVRSAQQQQRVARSLERAQRRSTRDPLSSLPTVSLSSTEASLLQRSRALFHLEAKAGQSGKEAAGAASAAESSRRFAELATFAPQTLAAAC